jgi:hypothetical protein
MTKLAELQNLFKKAVMKGESKPFLREIEEGGNIPPEKRLSIYAHAYRSRLAEVLQEDFPVLHTMVGDEMFSKICNQYIDLYPSIHPSLRYFGKNMEKFLKTSIPYCDNLVIGEMADFEWTFRDIFDAKDGRNVIIEDVAAIPPEAWTTLRIHLQPSFHIKQYKWNVPSVWSSVIKDPDNPVRPEKYPEIAHCIQWKSDLTCYFRSVENDEAGVLKLAQNHRNFPEICEFLIEFHGDHAPMRAADLFKGWVIEGLVNRLEHLNMVV